MEVFAKRSPSRMFPRVVSSVDRRYCVLQGFPVPRASDFVFGNDRSILLRRSTQRRFSSSSRCQFNRVCHKYSHVLALNNNNNNNFRANRQQVCTTAPEKLSGWWILRTSFFRWAQWLFPRRRPWWPRHCFVQQRQAPCHQKLQ